MAMEPRTTIGLKTRTKARLDANRAPGQCYDGFLCQLVNLWEETHPRVQTLSRHAAMERRFAVKTSAPAD